jgi:hypothetical protein
VEGELRRGQGEDQPTVARVDMRIPENVAEEGTIRFCIPRIDDHVRSIDHG